MRDKRNLQGIRFGRLIVIKEGGRGNAGQLKWVCRCDCGSMKEIRAQNLMLGNTISCGCAHKEQLIKRNTKHGQTVGGRIPTEYTIWSQMKDRCLNPNAEPYEDYGGRGIKVCKRWVGKNGYANFFKDMGKRPSKNHSLDRFPNNDGDYKPSNCRWGTQAEQSRNKRNNVWLEHDGKRMIMADWATELNMPQVNLRVLLRNRTIGELIKKLK